MDDSKMYSDANIEKSQGLYKFKVESGLYRTASGASRTYDLYMPQGMPQAASASGGPPYPVVVLIHGFLMSGRQHSNNAQYFAQRGFIALTPDLTKLLLGDETRMENVRDILGEINWLLQQNKEPKSPLYGLVDVNRIGLAGNSSGGAVCLEVFLEAQKAKIPLKAMCLLDGVPWDRTWDRISQLERVNILSLRAEPALCNYHARMLRYLALLKFPYDDIKINGAHHCDVENPTTIGCRCVCGTSSDTHRNIFQRLTYLYFRDTFHAPSFEKPAENFVAAVHRLQHDGKVVAELNRLERSELASTQGKQGN